MADTDCITKICPRCKETKGADAFTADSRTPTGLKCYCRQCCTKEASIRRAGIPKAPAKKRQCKPVPTRDEKVCPRCNKLLAVGEFGKSAQRRDGLQCWCRDCKNTDYRAKWLELPGDKKKTHSSVARAWRIANPSKNTSYMRTWRNNNPDAAKAATAARRARLKNAEGRYSADDIAARNAAQNGKCAYCRTLLKKKYHVDHIVPLAKGGTNWPRNLQLLCAPCNHTKHAKDPIDYAQGLGRLL